MVISYNCYVLDRAFHILSSIDLIMSALVFKLVIKYATSPSVLKCTLKGAPPGAVNKSSWGCSHALKACKTFWADCDVYPKRTRCQAFFFAEMLTKLTASLILNFDR